MENKQYGNGLGFGSVLFLIFLVLKLTGIIAWSWWWVFSPVWVPLAVVALILAIVFVIAILQPSRR